jgi:hypothetical protein
MADVNECVKLGAVCLWEDNSLPTQTLSFADAAGDPVVITSASIDMTVTKTDTLTAALTYDETDTTELSTTSGTLTYLVGAVDMATLSVGTYTIAITVALGTTWTRSAIQRLEIKTKKV